MLQKNFLFYPIIIIPDLQYYTKKKVSIQLFSNFSFSSFMRPLTPFFSRCIHESRNNTCVLFSTCPLFHGSIRLTGALFLGDANRYITAGCIRRSTTVDTHSRTQVALHWLRDAHCILLCIKSLLCTVCHSVYLLFHIQPALSPGFIIISSKPSSITVSSYSGLSPIFSWTKEFEDFVGDWGGCERQCIMYIKFTYLMINVLLCTVASICIFFAKLTRFFCFFYRENIHTGHFWVSSLEKRRRSG